MINIPISTLKPLEELTVSELAYEIIYYRQVKRLNAKNKRIVKVCVEEITKRQNRLDELYKIGE